MLILPERIERELNIILEQIKLNNRNLNILLRAPSGYGKTTTGFAMLGYLGFDNSKYYLPYDDGIIEDFNENKRYHFIDEAHLIQTPEYLYPFMDTGRFTFILATNESGVLKEPLRNRCIQFVWNKFSLDQLKLIINDALKKYKLSDEYLSIISERVRGNPRIAKIICLRLDMIFSSIGIPTTDNELYYIMDNILGIGENGLSEFDNIYLNYLKNSGGVSSLSSIINGTKIDRDTIIQEIEPTLINLRLINITSRGRKLL